MSETIFGRIIKGEIPCLRVYEDDHVLAFLDVNPLSPGHTLVIPKEAAPTLDKLSEESAAAIGRVLPRIARAVLQATGATAFNVLQNNGPEAHQAVFHVHFHIIPKFDGKGLGIGWEPMTPDPAVMKSLREKIAWAAATQTQTG
jgi:histidine triad (HIT) family protein